MQVDTRKKKIIIVITANIVGMLIAGTLTVYALKQHYKDEQVRQQATKTASQEKRIATAPDIEKEANNLLANGDLVAAKAKYQNAVVIYAEAKNTDAEERVRMQLSLIEHRMKSTPTISTDLSTVPIDRKLNAQLGEPAPISKP
jgi:hypothetical protein